MTYDYPPQQGPPRYTYAPQPPRYERNSSGVSLTKATVPIISAGFGAVMLVTATWQLKGAFEEIKASIERMQTSLNSFVTQSTERIAQLEVRIGKMEGNRWSIKDHDGWCLREELANKDWKCVPTGNIGNSGQQGSMPAQFAAPSWTGAIQRD